MSYKLGSAKVGSIPFAGASSITAAIGLYIACLGDMSSHGGTLITTNTDNTVLAGGIPVCANGCLHACPIPYHGTTPVTAVTTKSYINGKLIVTLSATAGCGASILPPDRKVYVE